MATGVLAVAARRYDERRDAVVEAITRTAKAWGLLAVGALSDTWDGRVEKLVLAATVAGQARAASGASAYIQTAMQTQGLDDAVLQVEESTFVGTSSWGMALEPLLRVSIRTVDRLVTEGAPVQVAMDRGQRQLVKIVRTQVGDAGKASDSVATVGSKAAGFVRNLRTPSCGRCAQLAGRFYRFNDGFERHPNCDCVHLPTDDRKARGLVTDPKAYFDSLTEEEQGKHFGVANAKAIRDGADLDRVVNASASTSTTDVLGRVVKTTDVLTRGTQIRLTPEQIYRDARDNNMTRVGVVKLLRKYRYIR